MPPAPTGAVNDYAGLLTAAERARLEAVLQERNRATGAQVAIAIFPSLEGESLEDFSNRLARQWRVGQQGLDNGVVLTVFVADRKARLEVGYGAEGSVTDAVTSDILRNVLAPRFREGQYARGLQDAVAAVFQHIEATPPDKRARPRASRGPNVPVVGFFVLLGVIVLILFRDARSNVSTARRNVYTARGGGWYTPIIVPPVGGGWGGGGSSGGDPGGGFSGGGGDFGGGGASGSW
ncbi:MAG: TPM domain-containing protein [Candidatus Rokubacteria bacterium]|nr:TPM domain-containing protein [Candidatus Rokubacteria bacterium]MBI3826450.1 TPM domain-containing protein [Candidatus Rokubacteria bacterium]